MVDASDWTEPEQALAREFHARGWLDLRQLDDDPARGADWGPERTIRASVLEQLLLRDAPTGDHIAKVRLSGAKIIGRLDLRDAEIDRAVILVDCWIERQLLFSGATMRGLILDRSVLASGFSATDAQLTGSLRMRDARAEGLVRLRGTRVTGNVDLSGSTFAGGLEGMNLAVDGDLRLTNGFAVTGTLGLGSARVAGTLDLDQAVLGGEPALDFVEGDARRVRLSISPESSGAVRFGDSRVGRLHLTPATWPDGCPVDLNGCAFERLVLTEPWPARDRMGWLERHGVGYAPGVYEQFAAAYRREGLETEARQVLRAKERRRHRLLNAAGRLWGAIQELTVGFGYAPGRALLWLAALLIVGTAYFAVHPLDPIDATEAPTWSPFVYTLDVIVPLVDFGHERAYDPVGPAQWVSLVLAALGWILAAAVVAGAGRTLNRR